MTPSTVATGAEQPFDPVVQFDGTRDTSGIFQSAVDRVIDQLLAELNVSYYRLDPDTVIHAVESLGLLCDGCLLALNSYENRVYQVGLDESTPVVAKFYRPGRWSDEAILEEHGFAAEAAAAEIPVVTPSRASIETVKAVS